MAYEQIVVERKGPAAVIRFNRPDKLNAMSTKMKDEIVEALAELERDDTCRAIVFTGAGEKAFVAGADIAEFKERTALEAHALYDEPFLYDTVDRFSKPVIAAINGYCLGGGCELALTCDIRIASETAQIGQPEVNIGIIPGGGGSQRLPRLVGMGQAMKLILTGDRIPAPEALRIGLVDEVVAPARLMDRALEIADRIAEKSPVAIRLAKMAIRASARLPLDEGLRYEQSLFGLAFASEDKAEGVAAFLEKRKPAWKGR